MAIVSKLLGIWLAGRTVTSTTPLFMRLLTAVAAVAVFAAIASALLALLLAGMLWLLYVQLIAYGIALPLVLIIMLILILGALSLTVYFVSAYLNQLRILSRRAILRQVAPGSAGLGSVANAFMEGLGKRRAGYRKS